MLMGCRMKGISSISQSHYSERMIQLSSYEEMQPAQSPLLNLPSFPVIIIHHCTTGFGFFRLSVFFIGCITYFKPTLLTFILFRELKCPDRRALYFHLIG
mmetsp:Transcript_69345/g.103155  ORF Transcript_69345/g.103155 Transcript_69345/m.103155 type:complete len:100 (-) Transcript_69345:2898-3197(-)